MSDALPATAPGYDWWIHATGATASFPGGNGAASATAKVSGPGRKIRLHQLVPLTGFTGPLTILKGDGTTNYFGTATYPAPANNNGPPNPLDIDLDDGLAISGGTTGAWMISYSVRY